MILLGPVLGTVLLLGWHLGGDFIPRQVLGKLPAARPTRLDPAAGRDLLESFRCRLFGSGIGQAVGRIAAKSKLLLGLVLVPFAATAAQLSQQLLKR